MCMLSVYGTLLRPPIHKVTKIGKTTSDLLILLHGVHSQMQHHMIKSINYKPPKPATNIYMKKLLRGQGHSDPKMK